MKLPCNMDAAELIKALDRLGYRPVRQTGSHIRLQCEDPTHAITTRITAHYPSERWWPSSPASLRSDAMERDVLLKLRLT